MSSLTTNKIAGNFTATGTSAEIKVYRHFNVSVSGFGTATVKLQRSFDGGATWETTDEITADLSTTAYEPERGIIYRFNCTAYTTGTIVYRIGAPGTS